MHRVSVLRCLPMIVLVVSLVGVSGCVNFAANIYRSIRGNNAPAEYKGLEGKKVAIVCGSERGLSNDAASALLTRYLDALLSKNVKDIKIVRQDKVEKWLDSNGWEDCDFEEIGKGVGADQVLAVTVANLTMREGGTLYKGKANISITVYDISGGGDGNVVYRRNFPEFEYPKNGGVPVTDTSLSNFQVNFLKIVSIHIGPLFYPADPNDLVGLDAISNSL